MKQPVIRDKETLKVSIVNALGKSISYQFDSLRFAFGYTRLSGEAIAICRVMHPERSDEDIEVSDNGTIHNNIREWCNSEGISCNFNQHEGVYVFSSLIFVGHLVDKIRGSIRIFQMKHMQWPTKVFVKAGLAQAITLHFFSKSHHPQVEDSSGRVKLEGLDVYEVLDVPNDFVEVA